MDFIKRFFSSKSKSYAHLDDEPVDEHTGAMEIDELFVYHFKRNGGAFFYPDDMDDFQTGLKKLLKYLDIEAFTVLERSYFHFLSKLDIPVMDQLDKNGVLLGGCEALIADEGSIMTTETHTKAFRNIELPRRRVIIALSNQITPSKTQALIDINNKYEKPPANIQTMSIFAKPKNDLSGNKWYETYLFLIEN